MKKLGCGAKHQTWYFTVHPMYPGRKAVDASYTQGGIRCFRCMHSPTHVKVSFTRICNTLYFLLIHTPHNLLSEPQDMESGLKSSIYY